MAASISIGGDMIGIYGFRCLRVDPRGSKGLEIPCMTRSFIQGKNDYPSFHEHLPHVHNLVIKDPH